MGQMKRHYLEEMDRDALQEAAQFRGEAIRIGDYALWDGDNNMFYILFEPTGEFGVFKKEDFVAHVAAFFGLHF
jgi:hypothetical protein